MQIKELRLKLAATEAANYSITEGALSNPCNVYCDEKHNVHYLGRILEGQAIDKDEFWHNANKPCCGCGAIGIPHIGFGFPCSASKSGAHYFDERIAELNK